MAKILVVDDEAKVRNVLTLFLTKKGYDVTCAEDGEAALSLLRADQALLCTDSFDVLIADVIMPKMDGLSLIGSGEVIDRLHGVIILTGSSNHENMAWVAQSNHRLRVIHKPFNPAHIAELVEDLMSSTSAMTET